MSQKVVPWEGSWQSSLVDLTNWTNSFVCLIPRYTQTLTAILSQLILILAAILSHCPLVAHLSPGLSASPHAWAPHSTVSRPRGLMFSSHRSVSTIVLSLRAGVTCQHCNHHPTSSLDTPRRQIVCPRPHRSRCTQRTPDGPN